MIAALTSVCDVYPSTRALDTRTPSFEAEHESRSRGVVEADTPTDRPTDRRPERRQTDGGDGRRRDIVEGAAVGGGRRREAKVVQHSAASTSHEEDERPGVVTRTPSARIPTPVHPSLRLLLSRDITRYYACLAPLSSLRTIRFPLFFSSPLFSFLFFSSPSSWKIRSNSIENRRRKVLREN